jgi:hypothetical protein
MKKSSSTIPMPVLEEHGHSEHDVSLDGIIFGDNNHPHDSGHHGHHASTGSPASGAMATAATTAALDKGISGFGLPGLGSFMNFPKQQSIVTSRRLFR